jgi:hypothetical protein
MVFVCSRPWAAGEGIPRFGFEGEMVWEQRSEGAAVEALANLEKFGEKGWVGAGEASAGRQIVWTWRGGGSLIDLPGRNT